MTTMGKAAVAIAQEKNPEELIRRTLSLLRIQSRLKSVRKVVIKPNLVRVPPEIPVVISPTPSEPEPYSLYANRGKAWMRTITPEGDITRKETLEALLEYLKELGIEDITIAEASGGWDTELAYQSLGFYELAEQYGARLVDLNWSDSANIPVPNGRVLKEFWVPNVVSESDFRISFTTLKVHGTTAVTLCLKNWAIGIPPGKYYGFNKSANRILGILGPKAFPIHHHFDDEKVHGQGVGTSKTIADVCSAIPYELGIIDGLTTVHRASLAQKAKMVVKHSNLMLASYDMVAVDSVATRVMGFDPNKILHIYLSEKKGLGTMDSNKIDVIGPSIKDVEMQCNPEPSQKGIMIT